MTDHNRHHETTLEPVSVLPQPELKMRFMDRAHEISRLDAIRYELTDEDEAALLASGLWRKSENSDYLWRTEEGLDAWWLREVVEDGGSPDYRRRP